MDAPNPKSISIEETVARMVNVDCDRYFPLLEMTEAFKEEAEVDYENAILDEVSFDTLERLRVRMEICRERHSLAQYFYQEIQNEIDNQDESDIQVLTFDEAPEKTLLALDSVSFWAKIKYGIDLSKGSGRNKKSLPRWEDVKIKIYANFRIGYFQKNQKSKALHFREIGLMGQRKQGPNHQGLLLIGLSEGKKFPGSKYLESSSKTAIHRLRKALQKIDGLNRDPFYPYDEVAGYKPRFNLIDDRKNADERAKEYVDKNKDKLTVSYEDYEKSRLGEARDFDIQEGEAQAFIDEAEKNPPG